MDGEREETRVRPCPGLLMTARMSSERAAAYRFATRDKSSELAHSAWLLLVSACVIRLLSTDVFLLRVSKQFLYSVLIQRVLSRGKLIRTFHKIISMPAVC
jgi:hypothetical protein